MPTARERQANTCQMTHNIHTKFTFTIKTKLKGRQIHFWFFFIFPPKQPVAVGSFFLFLQPLPRHGFISVNIHTLIFICKSESVSAYKLAHLVVQVKQVGVILPSISFGIRNQLSDIPETMQVCFTPIWSGWREKHTGPNLANDERKNITQTESKSRRRASQAEMQVLLAPLLQVFGSFETKRTLHKFEGEKRNTNN